MAGKSPVGARAGAARAGLAAPGGREFNSRPMVRGGDGGGGRVRVTGPGRGTRHLIAKAALATRPHVVCKRYRLAFDHGWDVVDEYELNNGTPAGTPRAIARYFCRKGVRLGEKFVRKTLERYFRSRNPMGRNFVRTTTLRFITAGLALPYTIVVHIPIPIVVRIWPALPRAR
eukprot:COSAG02_NODE_153_length_33128_cov_10.471253_3_plen_173_part_00